MGVQIGTFGRQQHDLGVGQLHEVFAERLELGVSVHENVARTREETAAPGQIASNLPHPISVRILRHTCDLHSPSIQPHGNENVEGGQAARRPRFYILQ